MSSKWDKKIKAALNKDTTTKMAFTSISKNSYGNNILTNYTHDISCNLRT